MTKQPEPSAVDWTRDLAALDDDRLRARLSIVPLRQQVDALLSLGWGDRLRFVRNSPSPCALVSRIPDEEILLTVKAIGEDDTLDLIALTTPKQLQFLLDVELWSHDSLSEHKVTKWLDYLLGFGEEKVVEFLEAADRDLLVLVLVKLVCLIPNEVGEPLPLGTVSIMQDEYFAIVPRIPKEIENTRLFLRVMRQWNRDVFYSLLFEAYGSAGPESEERAFRWRNARLEEKGLLEFDEAVEIYAYVGEEEARRLVEASEEVQCRPGAIEAPSYPVKLAGGGTFFSRVLASLGGGTVGNRLRSEIAFSANRLLVADAREIGDLESMRMAIDRLFSHLNVGLLFLSNGDEDRARDILVRLPIRDLFHIGLSRALDLKSRAMSVVRKWWPAWRKEGFTFLGSPEEDVLRGLMERVPQYWAAGRAEGRDLRDFRTMDEVKNTGMILDEIVAAADACFGHLNVPTPAYAHPGTDEALLWDMAEIDLRNVLATGFVNFAVRGVFEIRPLDPDGMDKAFEPLPEGKQGRVRRLKHKPVEEFLCWLREHSGQEDRAWSSLERFFRKALQNLEAEASEVGALSDLNPRYVRSAILKRQGREEPNG